MRKLALALLLLVLVLPVSAQDTLPPDFPPVEQLAIEVLNVYPHDTTAFTQGLLLHDDGLLYESTGRYEQSTLRAVEPTTGEVVRRYALPDEVFAEGLTLMDGRLIQLTWRAQAAFVYDLAAGAESDTFEPLGVFRYSGEGWGLCNDDELLYRSDGSNLITTHDPESFQPLGSYRVTLYGVFIQQMNELECVGDDIYANIWQSDTIVRFDKETGVVNALIDGSGLLDEAQRAELEGGAVLNGIAYNPDADTFYLTGKLWPSLFEVRLVPVGE
jgi:glutamine cyclotransferase